MCIFLSVFCSTLSHSSLLLFSFFLFFVSLSPQLDPIRKKAVILNCPPPKISIFAPIIAFVRGELV